jgi:uncharacterized protein (TIGR02646 family)
MRHISIDDLILPDGWEGRAKEALKRATAATTDADRSKAITDHSLVWRELKVALSNLSHRKCWYCEARQDRSDNNVDHFRPKNAVAGEDNHPGYWWLAFDKSNYRYSCTFCNCRRLDVSTGLAGGKQDYFPLIDLNTRISLPGADIAAERPELLDPTVLADTRLLYFETDGRAVPASEAGDKDNYRRAIVSIRLYHLNHTNLSRARKRLYRRIEQLITDGDVYFKPGPIDDRVEHARARVITDVLQLRSEQIPYWAPAQLYLKTFIDDARRPWLNAALG